jgi:hypothetical protein
VLEFDDVLQGAMIPFDFSLGHRMIRRAARMGQAVRIGIRRELPREIAGP